MTGAQRGTTTDSGTQHACSTGSTPSKAGLQCKLLFNPTCSSTLAPSFTSSLEGVPAALEAADREERTPPPGCWGWCCCCCCCCWSPGVAMPLSLSACPTDTATPSICAATPLATCWPSRPKVEPSRLPKSSMTEQAQRAGAAAGWRDLPTPAAVLAREGTETWGAAAQEGGGEAEEDSRVSGKILWAVGGDVRGADAPGAVVQIQGSYYKRACR